MFNFSLSTIPYVQYRGSGICSLVDDSLDVWDFVFEHNYSLQRQFPSDTY